MREKQKQNLEWTEDRVGDTGGKDWFTKSVNYE